MANPDNEAKVAEIVERLKKSKSIVVADYRGLSVSEMTSLRATLSELGAELKIYKNTLLKIAADKAGIADVAEFFTGPTALALSYDDPLAATRELAKYAKASKILKVKGGVLDGKVLTGADVTAVAYLPSKEVLLARLLGGMQSPLQGFANVLNGPIRGLAVTLGAIAAQKQA